MSSRKTRIRQFEKKEEELRRRYHHMVQRADGLPKNRLGSVQRLLTEIAPALQRLVDLVDELYEVQGGAVESISSDIEALIDETEDAYKVINNKLKPKSRPMHFVSDDEEDFDEEGFDDEDYADEDS